MNHYQFIEDRVSSYHKGVFFWEALWPIIASFPVAVLGFGLVWILNEIFAHRALALMGMNLLLVFGSAWLTFARIKKVILESGLSKLNRANLKKEDVGPILASYLAKHNAVARSSLTVSILGIFGAVILSNFYIFHFYGPMLLKLIVISGLIGFGSLIFTNVIAVNWAEKKYLKEENIFKYFGEIAASFQDTRIN